MQANVQMNNAIAIHIHAFEAQYERDGSGELVEHDVVIYSPTGDNKTRIARRIDRVNRVLPIEDCGDNISYLAANRLWGVIKPQYDHWKQNNTLPEDGTPLAAWPGVTNAQAGVLKDAGLRTVEDVASASNIVMTKTGISNSVKLRDLALKFLASEDDNRTASKMTTLEAENAEMKAQLKDLMELYAADKADKAPAKRTASKKAGAA